MKIRLGKKILLLLFLISLTSFVNADLAFGPEIFLFAGIALIVLLLVSLGVNFVINKVIIYLLGTIFKDKMNSEKHVSNKTVLYVTIAGLITDIVVLGVTQIIASIIRLSGYPLILVQGLIIAILITLISHNLVFKKIMTKNAIIASLIFGIISNPFWVIVVTQSLYSPVVVG